MIQRLGFNQDLQTRAPNAALQNNNQLRQTAGNKENQGISAEELFASSAKAQEKGQKADPLISMLLSNFTKLDTNKDGKLDEQELKVAIQAIAQQQKAGNALDFQA